MRPDPRVTLKDSPRAGTPGEVERFIPQPLATEAIELCAAFEAALSRAPRSAELESLFWRVREFLLRTGGTR